MFIAIFSFFSEHQEKEGRYQVQTDRGERSTLLEKGEKKKRTKKKKNL